MGPDKAQSETRGARTPRLLLGSFMETTSPQRTLARPISLDDRLRAVEANLIAWALKQTGGNKSRAAALLGIKRSTLGDRINRCGLGRQNGPKRADAA